MKQTRPRFDIPTAFLVGLPLAAERACEAILDNASFNVCRATDPTPAADRIPTIMPHVVVIPAGLGEDHIALIEERAGAVGAELVCLEPGVDEPTLKSLLLAACAVALRRWR